MAIQTINGTDHSAVNAQGLNGITNNDPILAGPFNADQADLQEASTQQMLSGVLAGGVCTASGLNVTIPSGTVWYARQCWKVTSNFVYSCTDSQVTWIFGCADGVIRVTAGSFAYPAAFDGTTAVLLTKASASGTVTLLNSVQHKARVADHANRVVKDGPLNLDYANGIVDASPGIALQLPAFSSDPTVPGTGSFVWVNKTSGQVKMSIDGTITPAVPVQTVRFGSGSPSSGLGIQGDVYLNTATGDIYLKGVSSYTLQFNTAAP